MTYKCIESESRLNGGPAEVLYKALGNDAGCGKRECGTAATTYLTHDGEQERGNTQLKSQRDSGQSNYGNGGAGPAPQAETTQVSA